MAVNFPDSPSTNDTFTSGAFTFTWNGSAWKLDPSSGTKGEKGQKGEVGVTGDKGQKGDIGATGGGRWNALYVKEIFVSGDSLVAGSVKAISVGDDGNMSMPSGAKIVGNAQAYGSAAVLLAFYFGVIGQSLFVPALALFGIVLYPAFIYGMSQAFSNN